jgi:hypothetical protein
MNAALNIPSDPEEAASSDPVPQPLRDALQAAIANGESATNARCGADSRTRREEAIETQFRLTLESLDAEINSNSDIDGAEQLANRRGIVSAKLTAASNRARIARQAQAVAMAEFRAARQAVRDAENAIERHRVRHFVTRFEQAAIDFSNMWALFCAIYLGGGRNALTAQEWIAAINRMPTPFELLDIGSPWADVPLPQLERTGEVDRPADARRHINALATVWRERLE